MKRARQLQQDGFPGRDGPKTCYNDFRTAPIGRGENEGTVSSGLDSQAKAAALSSIQSLRLKTYDSAAMRIYLGLGSNLGDPASNLAEAAERLRRKGIRIIRASSVYRTEPVGRKDQPWFLNQVVGVETDLSPSRLLRAVKTIERALGRRPGSKNGPRPIDIDILLAGDTVLKTADLEIPHARLAERRFVLVPLAEIASAAVHPLERKTVKELLRDCPDRSKVLQVGLSG